jgi:hypothetical protein
VEVAAFSLAIPSFTPRTEDLAVVNGPDGATLFSRIEERILYPTVYECLARPERQRAQRAGWKPKIERLKRACCVIDFTLEAPESVYNPSEADLDLLKYWLRSFVRYIERGEKNDYIDRAVRRIYFDCLKKQNRRIRVRVGSASGRQNSSFS